MTSLPPLVEPSPPLEAARMLRYARQAMLPGFGELEQRRLSAARVLVVGAGGLGSAAVPYLASSGIGTIGIADPDVVELSNLHRQTAHTMADLGRHKVDSLADTIAAIDPEIVVERHPVRLTSENISGILANYDLVVDGSDNFPTRYLTNDAAALAHKPLVWGAILRYDGQASVAWVDHGPTYRDLYPNPPAADEVLSCELGGVLPSVCAAIGAILANEVVKLVTGIGEPLIGRVATFDALSGRSRDVAFNASPDAAPITELIDYEQFCGVGESAQTSQAQTRQAQVGQAQTGDTPMGSTTTEGIDAVELARRLREEQPLQLVDVREPFEAAIATLPGSTLIPLRTLESSIAQVRQDVPVVVYCHHQPRAMSAVRTLREHGRDNVTYLIGGINAYAEVDTTLARY